MAHILRERNQLELPPAYPPPGPTATAPQATASSSKAASFESYQQQQLRSASSFLPSQPSPPQSQPQHQHQQPQPLGLFSAPVDKLAVAPDPNTGGSTLQITNSYERVVNVVQEGGEAIVQLCLPSGEPTRLIPSSTLASVVRIDLSNAFILQLNMMADPATGKEPPPLILKLHKSSERENLIDMCRNIAPPSAVFVSRDRLLPASQPSASPQRAATDNTLSTTHQHHQHSPLSPVSPTTTTAGSIGRRDPSPRRSSPQPPPGRSGYSMSAAPHNTTTASVDQQPPMDIVAYIKESSGSLLPPSFGGLQTNPHDASSWSPPKLDHTQNNNSGVGGSPRRRQGTSPGRNVSHTTNTTTAELNLCKKQLLEANALITRLHTEIDRLTRVNEAREIRLSETAEELAICKRQSIDLGMSLVAAEKQIEKITSKAARDKRRVVMETSEALERKCEKQSELLIQLEEELRDSVASHDDEKEATAQHIRQIVEAEVKGELLPKLDALSQENAELKIVISKNREEFGKKEALFVEEMEAVRSAFLKYDEEVSEKLSKLDGENATLNRQNDSLTHALSPRKAHQQNDVPVESTETGTEESTAVVQRRRIKRPTGTTTSGSAAKRIPKKQVPPTGGDQSLPSDENPFSLAS